MHVAKLENRKAAGIRKGRQWFRNVAEIVHKEITSYVPGMQLNLRIERQRGQTK